MPKKEVRKLTETSRNSMYIVLPKEFWMTWVGGNGRSLVPLDNRGGGGKKKRRDFYPGLAPQLRAREKNK
jgi:hypothetical protein